MGVWARLITPNTGGAFVRTETNASAFAAVSSQREWEGKRTVEGVGPMTVNCSFWLVTSDTGLTGPWVAFSCRSQQ